MLGPKSLKRIPKLVAFVLACNLFFLPSESSALNCLEFIDRPQITMGELLSSLGGSPQGYLSTGTSARTLIAREREKLMSIVESGLGRFAGSRERLPLEARQFFALFRDAQDLMYSRKSSEMFIEIIKKLSHEAPHLIPPAVFNSMDGLLAWTHRSHRIHFEINRYLSGDILGTDAVSIYTKATLVSSVGGPFRVTEKSIAQLAADLRANLEDLPHHRGLVFRATRMSHEAFYGLRPSQTLSSPRFESATRSPFDLRQYLDVALDRWVGDIGKFEGSTAEGRPNDVPVYMLIVSKTGRSIESDRSVTEGEKEVLFLPNTSFLVWDVIYRRDQPALVLLQEV